MTPSPCSPPFITNSLRVTDAWCLPAGGLLLTVQDTNKLLNLPRGYWFESQMQDHNRGTVDLSHALEKGFREWYYRDNLAEGQQFYLFQEDPVRNQQLKAVARHAIRGSHAGRGEGSCFSASNPSEEEQPRAPSAMRSLWEMETCCKITHVVVQHIDSCTPRQGLFWGPAWEGPLTVPCVSFRAALRTRALRQRCLRAQQCPCGSR